MIEDVLKKFKQTNVINNNNTSSPKDFSSFTGTLKDTQSTTETLLSAVVRSLS